MELTFKVLCFAVFGYCVVALPAADEPGHVRTERQAARGPKFSMVPNPDGSVTGTWSNAQAIDIPGVMDADMAVAQTMTIGPQGMSFSGSDSNSFNSPLSGASSAFSNANAMNSGLNGFSNSIANSGANSNPMFKSTFANTNANNFQAPQFPPPMPMGGPMGKGFFG